MRNCSTGVKYLCFFSVCILFLVSGCATPKHSNTLIFGTNTKFALDVSADPSGSPSITVGYKRQEAVWMPLLANQGVVLANQQDVVGIPAECKEENCLFIGTVCKDKECKDRDTYSVLASFGAKFSGEATGGPKATGGLAQYFATGLAARILAKEGGAKIVSVQPEDTVSEEIKEAAREAFIETYKNIDIIITYVQDSSGNVDETKLRELTRNTELGDNFINEFKNQNLNKFKKALSGQFYRSVNKLFSNIPKL